MVGEHALLVRKELGFVVQGVDDGASEAVHDGQSLSEEQEQDAAHEDQAEHDFVAQSRSHPLVDLLLKGAGEDVDGEEDLEAEGERPADEDDELQLVDALDHCVQLPLHHYPRHLEVQVEKRHQKRYHRQQVQPHVHPVHHPVAHLVHHKQHHRDQQHERRARLQPFQAVAQQSRPPLFHLILTLEKPAEEAERQWER